MLKRILIITIVLSLIIVAGLIYKRFDFYKTRHLLNPNNVEVINESNLNSDFINIRWSSTRSEKELLVYEKGEYLNPTFKEYGKNYLHVYYKDSLISTWVHFKTNNWHGHDYNFHISKKRDSIVVIMTAEGPDSNVFDSRR